MMEYNVILFLCIIILIAFYIYPSVVVSIHLAESISILKAYITRFLHFHLAVELKN